MSSATQRIDLDGREQSWYEIQVRTLRFPDWERARTRDGVLDWYSDFGVAMQEARYLAGLAADGHRSYITKVRVVKIAARAVEAYDAEAVRA